MVGGNVRVDLATEDQRNVVCNYEFLLLCVIFWEFLLYTLCTGSHLEPVPFKLIRSTTVRLDKEQNGFHI